MLVVAYRSYSSAATTAIHAVCERDQGEGQVTIDVPPVVEIEDVVASGSRGDRFGAVIVDGWRATVAIEMKPLRIRCADHYATAVEEDQLSVAGPYHTN